MATTHQFQRYSQPENVVTNNVLLLLRRLYELKPQKFERVLSLLMADQTEAGRELEVGPRFRQQIRGPERVADGLISQQGFDILIETKLGNAFDPAQAIGHLAQVSNSPNAVVLLLGAAVTRDDPTLAPFFVEVAARPNIRAIVCSFRALIDACRECIAVHEESLLDLVDDFEGFCVETRLLATDEDIMFVPPCGKSYEENIQYRLYYCPASRPMRSGAWLGIYANKAVKAVGKIELRVEVSRVAGTLQIDPAVEPSDLLRIEQAERAATTRWPDLLKVPMTFYLCSDMELTEFKKDSPGGIAGHRYFDLSKLRDRNQPLTAKSIADELRTRHWSEWGQS